MNDTEDFLEAELNEPFYVTLLSALLVLVISLCGLLCNLLSALVMLRHRAFRNPFGRLTALHALSNASILLLFSVWASPFILLEIPPSLDFLNRKIGQLSLLFVEMSFHACLFISINRFFAISSPSKYRRYFTDRATVFIMLFITGISGIYWAVYFIDGCDFYFDHLSHVWMFSVTPCGAAMGSYIDLSYNVGLFCVVGICDVCTLILLKLANKRFAGGNAATVEGLKRSRKEILFFIQALVNSCVYAFMLVCFHIISYKMTTTTGLFMATTVIWGFSHACGGVILIAFNSEIRRHLATPCTFMAFLRDPHASSLGTARGGMTVSNFKTDSRMTHMTV